MKDKLIYNQNSIPKDKWRYGLRSSADTGCGWIATYNALTLMGYNIDPQKLINYYEKAFPVINGNFGTFILNPIFLFKRLGFELRVRDNLVEFDKIAAEYDVCIVFYRWLRKLKYGSHYITVNCKDGKFYGYNTFKDSEEAVCIGDSLIDYIKRRKYFGAVIIGIKNKEKK